MHIRRTRLTEDSYLRGKTFTFFIGAEKIRYDVHVAALEAVSMPLNFMMTNDRMQESLKGEAVLEDVEPREFEELLKYAYQGVCGLCETTLPVLPPSATSAGVANFKCLWCGVGNQGLAREVYPFSSSNCRTTYIRLIEHGRLVVALHCVVPNCTHRITLNRPFNQVLCDAHKGESETAHKYPKVKVDLTTGDVRPLTPFSLSELKFGTSKLSHSQLDKRMQQADASYAPREPLHYAKLYVLANKYLVEDLQCIALYKLQRVLGSYKVGQSNIAEVDDFILYVYENTSDDGNLLDESGDELRRLVMAFVSDHSDVLMQHDEFMELMSNGGVLALDFLKIVRETRTSAAN